MTPAKAIRVLDTSDWGCDHTDEDTAAYEQACADAISAAFPNDFWPESELTEKAAPSLWLDTAEVEAREQLRSLEARLAKGGLL